MRGGCRNCGPPVSRPASAPSSDDLWFLHPNCTAGPRLGRVLPLRGEAFLFSGIGWGSGRRRLPARGRRKGAGTRAGSARPRIHGHPGTIVGLTHGWRRDGQRIGILPVTNGRAAGRRAGSAVSSVAAGEFARSRFWSRARTNRNRGDRRWNRPAVRVEGGRDRWHA